MIIQIVMPFTSVYWHRKFPVESSGVIWLADLMHLFQSSGCISMLGIEIILQGAKVATMSSSEEELVAG